MRLSVRPGEVGYENWCRLQAERKTVDVWCDGKRQEMVVAVDTDHFPASFVRLKQTPTGTLVLNGDEIETETVRGLINVVIVEGESLAEGELRRL